MTKNFCDICEKPAVSASALVHDFNPENEDSRKIHIGPHVFVLASINGEVKYPYLCRDHMREGLKKLMAAFESGEGVIEL